jgi:hypothetical protein
MKLFISWKRDRSNLPELEFGFMFPGTKSIKSSTTITLLDHWSLLKGSGFLNIGFVSVRWS